VKGKTTKQQNIICTLPISLFFISELTKFTNKTLTLVE